MWIPKDCDGLPGERAYNYDPVLNGWEVHRRLSETSLDPNSNDALYPGAGNGPEIVVSGLRGR